MAKKKKKSLVMPVMDAYRALLAVIPMTCRDVSRPKINCVHIRLNTANGRDVEFFGTNGHCISQWKKWIETATGPSVSFSIILECAERMVIDLKNVMKEHDSDVKKWNAISCYGKNSDPVPKEPVITFSDTTYTIPTGVMRLDLSQEEYPDVNKIISTKFGGTPRSICMDSKYIAKSVECFKKVSNSRNMIPIIYEFQSGDDPYPMVRLRADRVNGSENHAVQLMVFIMQRSPNAG